MAENNDAIISIISNSLADNNFCWQFLAIASCFVLAFFFYKILRRFVMPKIISRTFKNNAELNRLMTRYLIPLLYPLTLFILLVLGLMIYGGFFCETLVFVVMIKLIALFVFLRFLKISSNNNFITNAAGLFLIPAVTLDAFGLLDPTIEFLDQYAIKIGSVKISIYLVMKAFVVLLIVFWSSNLISRKSKIYIDRNRNIKSSTKNILSKFVDIIIYSIITIILLKTFGVDMTTLAVIGGAVGVGIGFGLQKITSNFISGIILLFEKSIEIGDIVELENSGTYGTVKHFSSRYTLIEGTDGKEIMVPNEEFIINKVTNWTYSNNRARIEIRLGVVHGSDLKLVKEIMLQCAKECARCLSYPEVECFVTDFGESDVKFVLYFWVSDIVAGRMGPKSEVIMNIWKKFEENNIKIALPQREVKVVN